MFKVIPRAEYWPSFWCIHRRLAFVALPVVDRTRRRRSSELLSTRERCGSKLLFYWFIIWVSDNSAKLFCMSEHNSISEARPHYICAFLFEDREGELRGEFKLSYRFKLLQIESKKDPLIFRMIKKWLKID